MKSYYAQIGDDSRIIRQLHEDRLRLKEQVQKLDQLVSSKELLDRDSLTDQLVASNSKVTELQKLVLEMEKKLEMVERNLSMDNKHLRGKLHSLEKEKEILLDQVKDMEETVKEKEKVIASLSIYRYLSI